MIVADFSVIPMGEGTSASKYVRAVHERLRQSGISFYPGPMSTSIEAESFSELFSAMEMANAVLVGMGVERIITSIRIDYRLDREISIGTKMKGIKPQKEGL